MSKVDLSNIDTYTPKQFKVANKYNDVKDRLNEFFYPFITPKELNVIGKVLRKIVDNEKKAEE